MCILYAVFFLYNYTFRACHTVWFLEHILTTAQNAPQSCHSWCLVLGGSHSTQPPPISRSWLCPSDGAARATRPEGSEGSEHSAQHHRIDQLPLPWQEPIDHLETTELVEPVPECAGHTSGPSRMRLATSASPLLGPHGDVPNRA